MDEESEKPEAENDDAETETAAETDEGGRSVSSDLIRGHINTIILRALYEGDKYGYEIIADIEAKSHGQYTLKQPSLYSALKRLEKDGCVTSYWGGSVSGGRRKYFSLTDLGKEIAQRNQSEWEYSRTIIDSLISDKDFDFNNPAPYSVDMRLLRDTTSRVPRESAEEEEESVTRMGSAVSDGALSERESRLAEEEARLREKIEEMRKEQEWREQELAAREEALKREHENLQRTATDSTERDELLRTLEEKENELSLARHLNETLKNELREQEERAEELKLRIIEEERTRSSQVIEEEKRRCESALLIERRRIEEEEARRADRYIAEETERIKREQEEIFARREQDLIRQNYHDLVSPPAPAPAEDPEPTPPPPPAPEEVPPDYYVRETENSETTAPPLEDDLPPARASDGIDFSEIEQRAALDGIRIATTGPKKRNGIATETSVSLVHKGKCLFLSAIVACAFCIVLGSILLGIGKTVAIPAFFPYVIWCVGIALLLAMGLAYANHYGERAIRRNSTIILINVAVIYALCVIFTLIVALSAKIDFSNIAAVASFIYIPIVFELTIPIFGVVYYFLVRAK